MDERRQLFRSASEPSPEIPPIISEDEEGDDKGSGDPFVLISKWEGGSVSYLQVDT